MLADCALLSIVYKQSKAQGMASALRSYAKSRSITICWHFSYLPTSRPGYCCTPRTVSSLRRGVHSTQPAIKRRWLSSTTHRRRQAREPAHRDHGAPIGAQQDVGGRQVAVHEGRVHTLRAHTPHWSGTCTKKTFGAQPTKRPNCRHHRPPPHTPLASGSGLN